MRRPPAIVVVVVLVERQPGGRRGQGDGADLFDQAQALLVSHEAEKGTHPIVLVDDAEGLTVPVVDALRRLTKNPLRIPEDLSADEALCITTLLDQISSAIWDQYHDEMTERLERYERHARADPRCPVCQLPDNQHPF